MVVAFADGHRFSELETVPLSEIAKESYLDRLHCEFSDDFLDFTKGSGLTLNIALRSEREDWILELLRASLGVCVMPTNSIILDAVDHRPVRDLDNIRNLELVMSAEAAELSMLAAFRDTAAAFDWG